MSNKISVIVANPNQNLLQEIKNYLSDCQENKRDLSAGYVFLLLLPHIILLARKQPNCIMKMCMKIREKVLND